MRFTARQLWTYLLVTAYGGIALVGHGLHSLAPDDGHHHGLLVVRCAKHGDAHWQHHHDAGCGHDHDHHHGPAEAHLADHGGGLVVTSNGCAAESHVCEICAFLSQIRGERVQLAAAVDWQPVVVAATCPPQQIYSPNSVGIHAPRGPPALIA